MGKRYAPQWIAVAVYLVLAALYAFGDKAVFDRVLGIWGVNAYSFAFLDTDTILSAIRCFNMGVDAYTVNPCDDLERVYTYSPLWTVLTAFRVTEAWIPPVGLLFCALFIVSIFLLPPARDRKSAVVLTIALLSSSVIFALERGNNDLVLFGLVAIGAYLVSQRPAARGMGYGLILLAGLLKYFPLALLALLGREKTGTAVRIGAFLALALLAVVVVFWSEFPKAFNNIPDGNYFSNWFGAPMIPRTMASLYGWDAWAAPAMRIVMTLAAAAVALGMAMERGTSQALAGLTDWEKTFLFAGCGMTAACYFTAQNIGYREIHLIMAIPALSAMAAGSGARRFKVALIMALAFLCISLRHRIAVSMALNGNVLDLSAPAFMVPWYAEHVLWWVLMTILLSILIALVAQFPMARALMPAVLQERFNAPTARDGVPV